MTEPTNPTSDRRVDLTQPAGKFKPLRAWPVIVVLVVLVAARFVPRMIEGGPPQLVMLSFFAPLVCCGLIVLWWLFASRATIGERIVGLLGIAVAAGGAMALIDKSMRGPAIMLVTVPMGIGLFGLAAILGSKWLSFRRTWLAVLAVILGFGFSTLLKSDGLWGHFEPELRWRWQPTSEDALLAGEHETVDISDLELTDVDQQLRSPDWPAFRGEQRDGRLTGVTLATNWSDDVTKPLWKIPVGPGWSSFSAAGDLLFTQEQRGDMEAVVCYDANTGREVWSHQMESRFDDTMGGPGPRATPTIADGQLFALGANGHLMRLDPKTGDPIWLQDLREVAGRKPPQWGFSSSPLVVGTNVIVHAGGEGDKGILAFDTHTGDLNWSARAGDHSYSSPQLTTIAGQQLVAMLTNKELTLLDASDGTVLLAYSCESESYRALQPQVLDDDSILIATGMGGGIQRVQVTNSDGQWSADEVWSSKHLKPDFNDFVVHNGHAYGFDGLVFTCIDLETGKRKWKKGRYGKGQVLLLADSGQLLITGEKGEVVLLKADSTANTELAKFQAVEGKTWNHPVLSGDRLLVRNSQQAACFRLPLAE